MFLILKIKVSISEANVPRLLTFLLKMQQVISFLEKLRLKTANFTSTRPAIVLLNTIKETQVPIYDWTTIKIRPKKKGNWINGGAHV